jgi:hypothetical protein
VVKVKGTTRKKWLLCVLFVLIVGAAFVYREFHPPVPDWIKAPPRSSVLVSRRFHSFMWGPEYYCRLHSPLSAWETAKFMRDSSQVPNQELIATQDERLSRRGWANGWGLERSDRYIRVDYSPVEIQNTGTEVYGSLRIWPEERGSTIEFYYETSF